MLIQLYGRLAEMYVFIQIIVLTKNIITNSNTIVDSSCK